MVCSIVSKNFERLCFSYDCFLKLNLILIKLQKFKAIMSVIVRGQQDFGVIKGIYAIYTMLKTFRNKILVKASQKYAKKKTYDLILAGSSNFCYQGLGLAVFKFMGLLKKKQIEIKGAINTEGLFFTKLSEFSMLLGEKALFDYFNWRAPLVFVYQAEQFGRVVFSAFAL